MAGTVVHDNGVELPDIFRQIHGQVSADYRLEGARFLSDGFERGRAIGMQYPLWGSLGMRWAEYPDQHPPLFLGRNLSLGGAAS